MMIYNKEFIGKKFKEYRKKSKLTQETLSEKVGIAEKHYGKLERGTFLPSLETFFKVIEILEIPLSEFGIQTDNTKVNKNREEIIKEIYSSNDDEILLYLNLIRLIKAYNK